VARSQKRESRQAKRKLAFLFWAAMCGPLLAQTTTTTPTSPPTAPTPDATSATDGQATTPAPADGTRRAVPARARKPREAMALPQVQIKGNDETETRRLSTAAKIIIGREEIEQYGDTTMGELFKRLPGVTVQGRPGRGGAPRMRGLGSGYTQILIDGERVPRGFSLDDLSPDEIERIEILRAPTAETGARAIAGTINIITRGGFAKHVNDLKLGLGLENGHAAPNIAWSRNEKVGDLIYNFSIAGAHNERSNDVVNDTLTENLSDGSSVHQTEKVSSTGSRDGVHANARLQWQGSGGDSFTLTPMLATAQNSGTSTSRLTQTASAGAVADLPYDHSAGSSDSRFATARLAGVWVHKLNDGATLRLSASGGQSTWTNDATRQNISDQRGVVATSNQHSEQHDTTFNANVKYSRTIAENHSLVTGVELESNRRNETATTLQDGESPLSDFDGNLTASSLRTAVYAQDEWNVTPHWAAHAGVRWEGIATTGIASADSAEVSN
jgi:outer membrane receptor for ferrienterochelin and colicins